MGRSSGAGPSDSASLAVVLSSGAERERGVFISAISEATRIVAV